MTESVSRVFAIVPAAGRSRRMGQAKQLMDVGGGPMLMSVLKPLAASDVAGVALITHTGIARELNAAALPRVFEVINDDAATEMIDSIRMGIRAWGERESISPHDGFLVCPADHPGITIADFNACIKQYRQDPTQIVVATRHGRRGHPILFPADLVAIVESDACDSGLNNLLKTNADRLCLVERESEGVIRDVNTPDDFREIGTGRDLQD